MAGKEPFVSVIVPFYHRVACLQCCVESILAQTLQDIELILVDDGSDDEEIHTVEALWGSLPQVILLRQSHAGVSAARNTGLSQARGKYIAFVDSDDTLLPQGLALMVGRAESARADVVWSMGRYYRREDAGTLIPAPDVTEREGLLEELPVAIEERLKYFFQSRAWVGAVWNRLYRRRFLQEKGIRFADLSSNEDTLFNFACLLETDRYALTPELYYIYHLSTDSILRAAKGWEDVAQLVRGTFDLVRYADEEMRGRSFFAAHPEERDRVLAYFADLELEKMAQWGVYRLPEEYRLPAAQTVEGALQGSCGKNAWLVQYLYRFWQEQHARHEGKPAPARDVEAQEQVTPARQRWLVLTHEMGGGVDVYLQRLFARHASDWEITLLHPAEAPQDLPAWRALVRARGIEHIFINHLMGFPTYRTMEALRALGIPYTVFLHDYLCLCPNLGIICQLAYCGAYRTHPYCQSSFAAMNARGVDLTAYRASWRAFLGGAERVLAPSRYAAEIVRSVYPELTIDVRPHDLPMGAQTYQPAFTERAVLTLAFLGTFCKKKGARYVLQLNAWRLRTHAPLRIVVIGEDLGDLTEGSRDGIVFHGRYAQGEAAALLARYEAAAVLVPSISPETYCYTAQEAMCAGYPVLACNVGAHAARIAAADCGWLLQCQDADRGQRALEAWAARCVTPAGRSDLREKAAHTASIREGREIL